MNQKCQVCGEWTSQRFCLDCEVKIKSIMEKMLPVGVKAENAKLLLCR